MRLASTIAAVAFVYVLLPKKSLSESEQEEQRDDEIYVKSCKPWQELHENHFGMKFCTNKTAPFIECKGEGSGECERLCKESGIDYEACAHLKHCDMGVDAEPNGEYPGCNDLKSCSSDDDCERISFYHIRSCKDKGQGKKCYLDGMIIE